MVKYIHIGYPKNFSTSLQRDYFSKHPEIYHLGIGLDNNLGYRDSMVEKTLEVYLKTSKHYHYLEKEEKIKLHFKNIFDNIDSKYKAIGISSEHLSFSFSYDGLSAVEKAKRIFSIFGKDTKIIMIVRNQFELIKSLYRESVRVGFGYDFESFFKLIYKYQDRNFVYDFRYDLVYKTYTSLFGKNNVHVLFFEDYKEKEGSIVSGKLNSKLFNNLNNILKTSNFKMNFEHYNESIPFSKILLKAKLNKKNPHDLGNHLLESAEKHRIKKYLEEDLSFLEEEKDTYSDVLIKRKFIEDVTSNYETEKLLYQADIKFVNNLKAFYENGNRKFEKNIDKKIPQSYHNLVL